MGADYYIECKCCKTDISSFYITINYNSMFPFWSFHKQDFYDDPKKYAKILRLTLNYYGVKYIYDHAYWTKKMKTRPEHHAKLGGKGWETNKYTVIMALIRLYWHVKRYGNTQKYKWSCWY